MVSIGDELVDGYKETSSWVNQGVKWLTDIQEFYKERAAIEREASTKLTQLVSKHFSRKASVSAGLSVGDTPATTPGSLENASASTWHQILSQTEELAKERKRLGDEFSVQISDQIGGLHSRFENLRDYLAEAQTSIEADRDSYYNAVKKGKTSYDEACESMEHARARGRKVENKEQDMVNAKCGYLLSINVANRIKDKFYHDDVPELLDAMQKVNEARVSQLNRVLSLALDSEIQSYKRSEKLLDEQLQVVKANRPELDTEMFIKHNLRQWHEPTDFFFQPSPVWHDDEDMITDDNGLKFLRARLDQGDRELDGATSTSQSTHKTFEKAKEDAGVDFSSLNGTQAAPLLNAYSSAFKNLVRAETKRIAIEVEIETIEASTAGHDMSHVPVTRTKTTRNLFGRKKEVVEVVATDGSSHNRGRTLGIKSLLARGAKAAGINVGSSGPSARILYEFTSGGPGELSVRAGEVLHLVEQDDGSGWIKVQRGEDVGIVPATYAEVTTAAAAPAASAPAPPPPRASGGRSKPIMIALYDYEAGDDHQLSIKAGDQISVVQADTGNGWTTGELNGRKGLFPTSYAQ